MKVVIFYAPKSEHETSVESYVREFKRETNRDIELINKDTPRGIELAYIYDILQFPTLAAMRDDGDIITSWNERDKWPTISELSFYG